MLAALDVVTPLLPTDRPRYLMGVGKPVDIVESVARGIDMFDCVLPTRSGRHGQAWTDQGPLNITNARFSEDMSPLDESLSCPASAAYSKAYLHHLFKAGEILGQVLLSWPANITGFALEETLAITSGVWTPVNSPVVDTATDHTVTVSVVGHRTYRLRRVSP